MKHVLVQHRSVTKKNGLVALEKTKGVVRPVVAVMITGEVKDSVGEVWTVKPASHSDYDYVTVSEIY